MRAGSALPSALLAMRARRSLRDAPRTDRRAAARLVDAKRAVAGRRSARRRARRAAAERARRSAAGARRRKRRSPRGSRPPKPISPPPARGSRSSTGCSPTSAPGSPRSRARSRGCSPRCSRWRAARRSLSARPARLGRRPRPCPRGARRARCRWSARAPPTSAPSSTATRALQASAALAAQALRDSRARLRERARSRSPGSRPSTAQRSRALGRDALVESDRALALGERARDHRRPDGSARATQASVRASSPRCPARCRARCAPGTPSPSRGRRPQRAAYRLPVAGKLVTGLGELSDTGVRVARADPRDRRRAHGRRAGGRARSPMPGRSAAMARSSSSIMAMAGPRSSPGSAAIAVRVGDQVAQGAPIGRAAGGDEPRVTVELRRRGRPIDIAALIG